MFKQCVTITGNPFVEPEGPLVKSTVYAYATVA